MAERRKRIDATGCREHWADLSLLNIEVEQAPGSGDVLRIYELARRWNITVYDAAYLDVAVRYNLSLASKDRVLLRAAESAGIAHAFTDPS